MALMAPSVRLALSSTLLSVLAGLSPSPASAGAPDIHVDGATCTLADAILAANDDTTTGGCVASAGTDTVVLDADVVLTEAHPSSTDIAGGRAGLPDVTSTLTLRAGTASIVQRDPGFGCEPDEADPAFRIFFVTSEGDLTLEGLEVAHGCLVAPESQGAFGGAIFALGPLQLAGSTVRDSTARASSGSASGGGISTTAATTITDSLLSDNLAEGANGALGGGIEISNSPPVTIERSRLEGNAARTPGQASGGAISAAASTLFVRESELVDNAASGVLGCFGGAIRAGATIASIESSRVAGTTCEAGSHADLLGGAIYLGIGTAAGIANSLIEGNVGRSVPGASGAGDYEGGGVFLHFGDLTVVQTTFADNEIRTPQDPGGSRARGGGLFLNPGNHLLENVTFAGNAAVGGSSETGDGGDALGGGLFVTNGVTGSLHLSTFLENRAVAGTGTSRTDGTAQGGGLAVGSDADLEIASSAFQDNEVAVGEGAPSPGDCLDLGTGLSSLGYNVVSDGTGCAFGGPGDVTGTSPGLGPLDDHGCLLTIGDGSCVPTAPLGAGSAAIDAGSCVPNGATNDARYFPRPVDSMTNPNAGDGCDAGAFEAGDTDEDGVLDFEDNCPDDANPYQVNGDGDGSGDECDLCLGDDGTGDSDGDGECADVDPDDGDPDVVASIFADGFESGGTENW